MEWILEMCRRPRGPIIAVVTALALFLCAGPASAQGELVSPASDAVAIASTPALPEAPAAARPNQSPADASPASPDATTEPIRAGQARVAELNLELSELGGFDAWSAVMVLSGLLGVASVVGMAGSSWGAGTAPAGPFVLLGVVSAVFLTGLGFKIHRLVRRIRIQRERDREVEALLRFEGVSLAVGSESGMATLNWRL